MGECRTAAECIPSFTNYVQTEGAEGGGNLETQANKTDMSVSSYEGKSISEPISISAFRRYTRRGAPPRGWGALRENEYRIRFHFDQTAPVPFEVTLVTLPTSTDSSEYRKPFQIL